MKSLSGCTLPAHILTLFADGAEALEAEEVRIARAASMEAAPSKRAREPELSPNKKRTKMATEEVCSPARIKRLRTKMPPPQDEAQPTTDRGDKSSASGVPAPTTQGSPDLPPQDHASVPPPATQSSPNLLPPQDHVARAVEAAEKRKREAAQRGIGDIARVERMERDARSAASSDLFGASRAHSMRENVNRIKLQQQSSPSSSSTAPPPPPAAQLDPPYFEPQKKAECGRHALNHLYGGPQFQVDDMSTACGLVLEELRLFAGLDEDREEHAKDNGWYSHSVLAKAFDLIRADEKHKLLPTNARPDQWSRFQDPRFKGCLVNQDNVHWIALRAHGNRVYLLDSTKRAPQSISEHDFVQIIHRYPSTFWVVQHHIDPDDLE